LWTSVEAALRPTTESANCSSTSPRVGAGKFQLIEAGLFAGVAVIFDRGRRVATSPPCWSRPPAVCSRHQPNARQARLHLSKGLARDAPAEPSLPDQAHKSSTRLATSSDGRIVQIDLVADPARLGQLDVVTGA
jgi:hypothetical protein